MKKNFRLILIALAFFFIFISCSDKLNIGPLDSITEEVVWKDKVLTEGFLTDVVNSSISLWTNNPTDMWTDNCIVYEVQSPKDFGIQLGEVTPDNSDAGWNAFESIRKVNLFLLKIEESKTAALFKPEVKARMVAEARVCRALIYYWLALRFGGYIILDKPLSPEDNLKLPRNTEEEVYNFIVQDIESALPNLPVSTTEKFRITAGAAHALMTSVGLQAPQRFYDKVIASAKAVEQMGYSLDSYFNMFNTFEGLKSSKEIILSWAVAAPKGITLEKTIMANILNNIDAARKGGLPPLPDGFSYIVFGSAFPSQELVDDYLFKNNGNPIQKRGVSFEGRPATEMWMDRDNRFEQSIIHDNSNVYGAIFNFKKGGNQERGGNGVGNPSLSGYFFKKWFYESVTKGVYATTPAIDWGEPIFRLGKVFLNAAEAYARKNDLENALIYLNKTRTSHGGLATLITSSLQEFWKYYKIERRVEVVYENDRYWSLIRWSRAENDAQIPEMNRYLSFINLYQYDDGLVRIQSTEGKDYRGALKFEVPKRFFFPIPLSEIQNNDKLTQNEGY